MNIITTLLIVLTLLPSFSLNAEIRGWTPDIIEIDERKLVKLNTIAVYHDSESTPFFMKIITIPNINYEFVISLANASAKGYENIKTHNRLSNSLVTIGAGWFDTRSPPVFSGGLKIDDIQRKSIISIADDALLSSLLCVGEDGEPKIIKLDQFPNATYHSCMQTGPILIEDGLPTIPQDKEKFQTKYNSSKHQDFILKPQYRTVLGILKNGDYYILSTTPATLNDLVDTVLHMKQHPMFVFDTEYLINLTDSSISPVIYNENSHLYDGFIDADHPVFIDIKAR